MTDPVYRQAAEAGLDDVATMQLIDINTWLPGDILVKADRMAMAHGLELRTPFLDREVLAVAAKLARVEKTAAGTTKFALREAIGDLLPQAAAERAKLGFPVPLGHWLRGSMFGFAEHAVRTAQTGQWLNKNAAMDLLRRFRAGEPEVTWRQVWLLVVFSLWHQIYVERVYDPVMLGWEAPPPPGDPGRTAPYPGAPGAPGDVGRTAAYPGAAADPGRTAAHPAPAEARPGRPVIFSGPSDQHSGPPDIFSPTTGPRPSPAGPYPGSTGPHPGRADQRPTPPGPYQGPVGQDPDATFRYPGAPDQDPDATFRYPGTPGQDPDATDRYPGAPDQDPDPTDQDPDVTDQYPGPPGPYPSTTDPYPGRPGW